MEDSYFKKEWFKPTVNMKTTIEVGPDTMYNSYDGKSYECWSISPNNHPKSVITVWLEDKQWAHIQQEERIVCGKKSLGSLISNLQEIYERMEANVTT